MITVPTVADIEAARAQIDDYVVRTPVWPWQTKDITDIVGPETLVFLKLELFQHSGTFKPRGVLVNMLAMSQADLEKGITAFSAGNHAIAVAYGAQQLDSSVKVVMPKTANSTRVEICKSLGAEVVLMDDIHQAFDEVHRIEANEGRTFVHPFEGRSTVLGTATVGLELCQQVADLDAVIVSIGGGGLCAGVATAVKQLQPHCQVFGVEPEGADTMHRSFASGQPESIDKVRTIADSLGAPHTAPYTFGLCQKYVDELVMITDEEIKQGMALLFRGMKLAVEPAGAAAIAALCGPLLPKLKGKRVGIIVCGANIDADTVAGYIGEVS